MRGPVAGPLVRRGDLHPHAQVVELGRELGKVDRSLAGRDPAGGSGFGAVFLLELVVLGVEERGVQLPEPVARGGVPTRVVECPDAVRNTAESARVRF